MFVSTYSTYLNTNSINKTDKNRDNFSSSKSSELFKNALSQSDSAPVSFVKSNPLSYITHNKVISTKQRLNQQLEDKSYEKSINKFSTISSQINAPSSYYDNTKMFSLVIKHPNPFKQEKTSMLKDLEEPYLKNKMVNTYIENNKYYQITA